MTTTNKIRTGEGLNDAEQTSALSVTQQMADPDETRINGDGDEEDMDEEDLDEEDLDGEDLDEADMEDDDLPSDNNEEAFDIDEESIEEDVTTDNTDKD